MIRVVALGSFLMLASCGPAAPVRCTAANCSGCCTEAGECLGAMKQSAQACGGLGGSCRVCLPQQLCSAFACVRNPDAGVVLDDAGSTVDQDAGQPDSGVSCGARQQPCCANATCFLTLSCQRGVCDLPATSDAGPCGGLGEACCANQLCTGGGTTCNGGSCVAVPPQLKGTGEACAVDGECIDGACLGVGFANGYCTKACTTSANCVAGSQCGNNPSGVGPPKVCLKQCTLAGQAPGGCRTSYVCESNAGTSGVPVCFPGCTVSPLCGLASTCDSRGFCCGVPGFVCCEGSTCQSGNSCTSGSCQAAVACGNQGQACCTSGTACLGQTVCQSNGCNACGGLNQPCCASSVCSQGTCTSGTCQVACGNAGQACCTSGTACLGQTVCQASGCNACGGLNQPCCASSVCSQGTCTSGTCQSTMTSTGVGTPCASSTTCTGATCFQQSGAQWQGGYCSQVCSLSSCPSGSSCATHLVTGQSYCLQDCIWDGGAGGCRANYVCDRYLLPSPNPAPTCISACTIGSDCQLTNRCSNGFCCGQQGFRCCQSGAACDLGTCGANGYCQ